MADNTTLNIGSGGDVIATDEVTNDNGASVSGYKIQRNKLSWGADGEALDVNFTYPLPVQVAEETQATYPYSFWASNVTAGTTNVEALVTLTTSTMNGSAVSTGTSVLQEYRFRITSIMISVKTHASNSTTGSALIATLRINTGGAITTSSNAAWVGRAFAANTAHAWDRLTFNFGDRGPVLNANSDSGYQFGMTVKPTFSTNAPTYDVLIYGYEF